VIKFGAARYKVFLQTRASKKGTPSKNDILPLLVRLMRKRLQIGTDILPIITSTGHELFLVLLTSMTLNDLKPQKVGFLRIFGCSAYFKSELQ